MLTASTRTPLPPWGTPPPPLGRSIPPAPPAGIDRSIPCIRLHSPASASAIAGAPAFFLLPAVGSGAGLVRVAFPVLQADVVFFWSLN
jgi:hypothetical protein